MKKYKRKFRIHPTVPRPVFESDLNKSDLLIVPDLSTRYKRLKRNLTRASQIITEELDFHRVDYKAIMVTLTYRDADVMHEHSDIREYIQRLRVWISSLNRSVPLKKRNGRKAWFKYVWVIEQTKTGRPHYHVLFWLPKWLRLPNADTFGWWRKGLSNQVLAKNAVGYLVKYCSKCGSIAVPFDKGVRLFGLGGLTTNERDRYAYFRSPSWLKFILGNHYFHLRKKGVYWVVEKTYGYSSPYSYNYQTSICSWRGWQPIVEVSSLDPVVPSDPGYKIDNELCRLRFLDLIEDVFSGLLTFTKIEYTLTVDEIRKRIFSFTHTPKPFIILSGDYYAK